MRQEERLPNVVESSDESEDESDFDPNADSTSESDSGEQATNTHNDAEGTLNQEGMDMEDPVVQAIMSSRELYRDHPPAITLEDYVVDVCFHPARDLIALASIMGDVLMYKYTNEESTLVSELELHTKACRDIEFSENGDTLFSVSKDKCIILTDVETEKMKRVYQDSHEHPIYSITVLTENTFATGDEEGAVKLWDTRRAGHDAVIKMRVMESHVSAMVTNSEKKYLVCASGDGTLTTINMPAKKLHVQSEDYKEELTCLGLFKTETKILAGTSRGKMYLFNWGEFGLHSDELPSLVKEPTSCMVPITETVVVTGDDAGLLRATSIFPHKHLGIVGQHDAPIQSVDISNDGTLIASSSDNNEVKFWNVKYFETLNIDGNSRGGKRRRVKHNLPSSKMDNASDFFADL